MKNRLLIISLIIIDLALLSTGLFDYFSKDSDVPIIELTNKNLTYKEGEDASKLLTGIKAYDEKDGDLTSEVFIEKIIIDSNDSAIVYYGVVDSANNATIVSRTVKYEKIEEEVETIDTDLETADKTNKDQN